MQQIKEREEREKADLMDLLSKQIQVEGELVGLYDKTVEEIKSPPVKHLLHMIRMDSMKHIDIFQVAMEVFQGDDILKPEKKELAERLKRHIELEKDSIERSKQILKNTWISEIKGLKELMERWRDDEKEHHRTLMKLTEKEFFRVSPTEWVGIFQDLEERYAKYERKKS